MASKSIPLVESRQHPGGGFTAAIPLKPHDPTCTVRIYRGAVETNRAAEKMASEIRSEFKPLRRGKGGQLQLDFRLTDSFPTAATGVPDEVRHLKSRRAMIT